MVEFNSLALGLEVGSGGILGAIAGYAAKKIIKLAMVIVGLIVLGLKYLETRGIITVNWSKVGGLFPDVSSASGEAAAAGTDLAGTFASMLPFGGSFAVGFMLGMKKG